MQISYAPHQAGSFLSTITGRKAELNGLHSEAGRIRDILMVPGYATRDDILAALDAAHAAIELVIERYQAHES